MKFKVRELILWTLLVWGLLIGNYSIYKVYIYEYNQQIPPAIWQLGTIIGAIADFISVILLFIVISTNNVMNTEIRLDKFDKK